VLDALDGALAPVLLSQHECRRLRITRSLPQLYGSGLPRQEDHTVLDVRKGCSNYHGVDRFNPPIAADDRRPIPLSATASFASIHGHRITCHPEVPDFGPPMGNWVYGQKVPSAPAPVPRLGVPVHGNLECLRLLRLTARVGGCIREEQPVLSPLSYGPMESFRAANGPTSTHRRGRVFAVVRKPLL